MSITYHKNSFVNQIILIYVTVYVIKINKIHELIHTTKCIEHVDSKDLLIQN